MCCGCEAGFCSEECADGEVGMAIDEDEEDEDAVLLKCCVCLGKFETKDQKIARLEKELEELTKGAVTYITSEVVHVEEKYTKKRTRETEPGCAACSYKGSIVYKYCKDCWRKVLEKDPKKHKDCSANHCCRCVGCSGPYMCDDCWC